MMRCGSCEIELTGSPLLVDGKAFCCAGCAEGGPCTCTYEGDQGRYPHNGHSDPMVVQDLFEEES